MSTNNPKPVFLKNKQYTKQPNPTTKTLLTTQQQKYKQQKCFCALITDTDHKKYEFNISNNDGASSSIFKFGELSTGSLSLWPNKKKLSFTNKIYLNSITIDTILKENNIDPNIYNHWNMDLQGAELLALKGSIKSNLE